MSQHVELPDDVYNTLKRVAEQEGTTPAAWIAEKLPEHPRSQSDRTLTDRAGNCAATKIDTGPDAWDVLDTLTGTVEAPEDWAAEHDHYIAGSPKRQKEG